MTELNYGERIKNIVSSDEAGEPIDLIEVSDLTIALHSLANRKIYQAKDSEYSDPESSELDGPIEYLKSFLPDPPSHTS